MNNDCFRNLHLTTAYGGASPQGEAFERFASKPCVSQYGYVEKRQNQKSLPCLKGGGPPKVVEGYMERKHNTDLTTNARTLRKNMTKEERHLWYDFLKSYPVRFLRQKIIDNYIVDFYCHGARLIIELDGSQHYEEKGLLKDKVRTERIEKRNLTVIRIPNNEVNKNFGGVCQYIDNAVKESLRQSATDTSL